MAVGAPAIQVEEIFPQEESVGQWGMAWRRLRHHRLAMIGAVLLVFFTSIS
jgi:hypothetical protein